MSVCRSAFDDGDTAEIVVRYLALDFKVLLVRLNLGSSLRENCRSLHPTPSLGVNTNTVANYATTQSAHETIVLTNKEGEITIFLLIWNCSPRMNYSRIIMEATRLV